jgi:hypothetical protein|tara:strand:+ start:385 stop:546 length:162 start_codon:yes stop_codon:yes gene_type:complete
MKSNRNPVKKNMDQFHKPKTQRDKVKAYRKQRARDKQDWDLDNELYELKENKE